MAELPEREETIPLIEERVELGTREVERGRVVVRTRVEERDEIAEAALQQEDVTVERVPVGRPVEAAPPVREEDGVMIVPVLEERLIVTIELILKEEIRITKKGRTEVVREPVRLRSERAEVERLEGRGPSRPNPEERSTLDDGTHPDRDV
jgi:stress response protein YsnF